MSEQFDSALPQYELGKVETDAGFFKALFHLHAIQAMNCIPAIVESYDRKAHMAEVRPLIKYETRVTDGKLAFDRPLYTVPVHQICQGGFLIDAPMFAGDTGLLFSIDREWITAKRENSKVVLRDRDPKNVGADDNKGPVVADSEGILSFEYGFFLPCSWAETGLSNEDGVIVKIPTKDGVVAIKIDREGKVTFGGEVVFEDSVTFKAKINGTEAEFSGLMKAKDLKTEDCEILELNVVTDANIEDGVTTLKVGKFKILRSQIIGDIKEVEVYGGGTIGPQGPEGQQGEPGEPGVGIVSIESDATSTTGYTSTNVTVTLSDNSRHNFTVNAKDGVSEEQSQTVEVITGITPEFRDGKLILTLQKRKIKTSSIEVISDGSTDVTIFDINNTVDVVSDVKYSTSTLILSQAKIPIISVGETTSETEPTNSDVFTATEHETDI